MLKNPDDRFPFRYYDIIAIFFVVSALIGNLVSYKMVELGPFTVRFGVFVSAFTYIAADMLVEVYGFARLRRVIWMMLASVVLTALIFKAAILWPAAAGWEKDQAFSAIFDRNMMTVSVSLFAMFAGHMANGMIMSKMKTITEGRMLWLRLIASSFVAYGLGATLYYSLAHVPEIGPSDVVPAILSSWFVRLCYEAIALPLTMQIITMVRKIEGVDVYDTDTNLNPFRFSLVTK